MPKRKMTVLSEILNSTRNTLPEIYQRRTELERQAAAAAPPPEFAASFQGRQVALLAEVKRRSPSAGLINPALDPLHQAREYQAGGAAAISVLTEPHYFSGSLADLISVVQGVALPVLRKDFILDEVQLLEARAAGAAAVLLIVRALEQARLEALLQMATDLGLGTLVETHDAAELERALDTDARVIGVNARNLDNFSIDRKAAWQLLSRIPPERIAVAESGMASRADVELAAEAGADLVLVGGALAASPDPARLAAELSGVPRRGR